MTSFEPVDRREIAHHVRRWRSASEPPGGPLDDAPAPEIEDLGGAASANRGFDRRAAVAIAAVAAIVTFGFAGRMSGRSVERAPSSTARPAAVVAAPAPPSRAALELVETSAGADRSTATFVLHAARPLGPVGVALSSGPHVLGTTTFDIAAPGSFIASVPVGVVPFRIDATLRVTPAQADADPLLVEPVRLEPPTTVTLTAVRVVPAVKGVPAGQLVVEGFASTGVDHLGVVIASDRHAPIAEAAASFSGGSIGWGGVLLGGRPFVAALDAAGARPGSPVRLVLTWADTTTGATASIERTLVVPERTPDTIVPDDTHLPWAMAED